jgi:hypothetical protein
MVVGGGVHILALGGGCLGGCFLLRRARLRYGEVGLATWSRCLKSVEGEAPPCNLGSRSGGVGALPRMRERRGSGVRPAHVAGVEVLVVRTEYRIAQELRSMRLCSRRVVHSSNDVVGNGLERHSPNQTRTARQRSALHFVPLNVAACLSVSVREH